MTPLAPMLMLLTEEFLGVLVVLGLGAYLLVRWFRAGTAVRDPWEDLPQPATPADGGLADTPVCIRCLTPHAETAYFCPRCGHAVGPYNNWMPFVQLFSEGEVMRTATDGSRRMTPFTLAGYALLSMATLSLFAPLYWLVLVRRYLEERKHSARRLVQPPP